MRCGPGRRYGSRKGIEGDKTRGTKIAHRLVVRVDDTLYKLKNKGIVPGNFRVHKSNPLVNYSGFRSSVADQGSVGG